MPYRFLHILNIITLLFATTGLAFNKHYCQDKLKSISIFTKTTAPCCKNKGISCKKTSQQVNTLKKCISVNERTCEIENPRTTFSKKQCCLNQFEYADGGLNAQPSLSDDQFFSFHPAILEKEKSKWVPSYKSFYYYFDNKGLFYLKKRIPPLQPPLFILHQSFLC